MATDETGDNVMTGHGKHIGPTFTQPAPLADKTVYVNGQIQAWRETGVPVHEVTARAIAGWYEDAYGEDYEPFAATGTITLDLIAQLSEVPDSSDDKSALRAYVLASRLPAGQVWTVGHNIPGYLPESDTAAFTSREAAIAALRDNVESANEEIEHNEVEGREDHPDCDACANDGVIGAAITDPADDGSVHVSIDDGPSKVVYWAVPNDRPFPATELIDHSRV